MKRPLQNVSDEELIQKLLKEAKAFFRNEAHFWLDELLYRYRKVKCESVEKP